MSASSFRDTFASRLREVRNQAKDMKLPSFDDMAAKDEYIHSEEFNVKRPVRFRNDLPEQRQGTTMDSIDEVEASVSGSSVAVAPSLSVADVHNSVTAATVGTPSAWSLLDGPTNHTTTAGENGTPIDNKQSNDETAQQTPKDTLENNNIPHDAASTFTPANKPPPAATTSTPLLSIVSETMQDTPPAVKQMISPVHSSALQRLTSGSSYSEDDDDDSDDHSSEGDEEDPILAMMQHDDKHFSKIRQKRKKKKNNNKNRFMEDLDRRMELQPNNEYDTTHPSAFEIEHGNADQSSSEPPTTATPYFTRGPFGGAVLNMAMTKFNKIMVVKKPTNNNRSTSPIPPLARERMTTTTPKPASPEDDFQVTNSNSVLSLGELQELKSKRHQGMQVVAAQLLQEHRHFAFIGFTLVLAVVVYFLTHKNLEDDVT